MRTPWLGLLVFVHVALGGVLHAQVSIVASYTQNYNSIGTALPAGWDVWTSSTATGNGLAGSWSTAPAANNATASASTYFRNLPGASQNWTASLSAGTDRAIGWRTGNAASRDGSITFTLANTTGYNLNSLSFQLFTPNSSGASGPGTYQLQYQIGASGIFTQLAAVSYTNDTAQNPLLVTTITLSSGQLTALNNQAGQVTLRWDNTATTGTAFHSLALDNFSYTAAAIPEPSTCAVILGVIMLCRVMINRRRASSPSR